MALLTQRIVAPACPQGPHGGAEELETGNTGEGNPDLPWRVAGHGLRGRRVLQPSEEERPVLRGQEEQQLGLELDFEGRLGRGRELSWRVERTGGVQGPERRRVWLEPKAGWAVGQLGRKTGEVRSAGPGLTAWVSGRAWASSSCRAQGVTQRARPSALQADASRENPLSGSLLQGDPLLVIVGLVLLTMGDILPQGQGCRQQRLGFQACLGRPGGP